MKEIALGEGIAEYLEKLPTPKQNLLLCWQRVAAPHFIEHTDNVVFEPGSDKTKILVYLDSAAYATDLSMDKELYRLKMQEETKQEIDDILFLVSRKAARRKR